MTKREGSSHWRLDVMKRCGAGRCSRAKEKKLGAGGRRAPRSSRALAALLAISLPLPLLAADPLDNLKYSLAGGAPNLDLRLRSETVDQDNFSDKGAALTVRARVGYTTGKWNGLDAQLEYEGVSALGDDKRFNSTENQHGTQPVVADPDFNEVNQAWLRYSGLPGTLLKLGRQRIVLDNARFLGNVGWRQNEMTYDAALISTTWVPRTTLTYAFMDNVNSFRFFDFDPDPAAVRLDKDIGLHGHVINASVMAVEKKLTLTGYGYLFDFQQIPAAPAARLYQDTQTLGLRATGALPLRAFSLSYVAEFAAQRDYADAPQAVDADYRLLEAGLGDGRFKAALGHETLGGDGAYSFQTPLATAHAHQGWADQFLITPPGGLQRGYLSLGATVRKLAITAVYHEFESDAGSIDYGEEVDLLLSYAVIENFQLSAKHAAYSADKFPTSGTPPAVFDTTKTWLYAEYRF